MNLIDDLDGWTNIIEKRACEIATRWHEDNNLLCEGNQNHYGSAVTIAVMCEPIENALKEGKTEEEALKIGIQGLKDAFNR